MRVAMASPWPPWRKGGGTELHTHELSTALVALGHDVTVLTLDIPGQAETRYNVATADGPILKLLRWAYHHVTFGKAFYRQAHDWGFNRKAARLARRLGADVLHRQGVATVPTRTRLPLVLTVHNGTTPQDEQASSGWLGRLLGPLGAWDRERRAKGVRRCIDAATEVIPVSEHVLHTVVHGVGSGRPAFVIANGCATPSSSQSRAEARRALGVPAKSTLVLFVGRLSREKRPLRLLALLDDPRCHLAFLGTGPLESQIAEEVARMPAERAGRVHRLGFLDEESKTQWLRGSDVLALPSGNFEGNPLVMMEALRQGTPVYGTLPEWLPEELRRFGRFGDDVRLALEAAKLDAKAAPGLVPTWDQVALETLKVYEKALGRTGARRQDPAV